MSNILEPWITKESKIIHKTPWVEVIEDICVADKTEFKYTYTKRVDEGPLIIAEDNDGSLWLAQQYRHPVKKIIWQLPIEGRLREESWEEAAKRGLKEELQLEAEYWVNLGEYFVDPGGLEQKYQLFLATELKTKKVESHHQINEVEELRVKKFSREEIDEMISNGEICDNWTLAGLYLFDRYKLKNK